MEIVKREKLTYCEFMTGAILAGGKSSRFGENKALFPIHGIPIIKKIIDILHKNTEELFIVARDAAPYKSFGVKVIKDIYPGKGPLAGLHASLLNARSDRVFLIACDMPFLSDKLVAHMRSIRSSAPVVVPLSQKGLEPLHAIYKKELVSIVEKRILSGNLSLKGLVESVPHTIVRLDELPQNFFTELSVLNINTKLDLEKATQLYDKCVSDNEERISNS
ncbi:Molybdopterin-guanine dinucleotide biosynthesis protein MobA [Dissulfuribacter thermophilus]|uniref:Probable molybdenum cofactor guanylyltransferase n=1 Tax=Dissulfuribacter thermophilus TaxID=1156395 RepID=A0A1B9F5F0_9BACT|nr:molybdenum cofactor guanylyltransferase [Dissulfuribacter thermophilus]OCC14991.1 Molybdopterin-guanine dinucleotide biosynthesis protein MobA [Dissulfuribacter thermophilus]